MLPYHGSLCVIWYLTSAGYTQLRSWRFTVRASTLPATVILPHRPQRDGFCGTVVGNSWGTCSARSCRPKWEHAWLTDSFGLERNSRAQSIANGIHLQRWNLSQHYRMTLSDGGSGDFKRDLRSRNRIYLARLRGGVLQYRLKYRNADLGTSSKAPRFCLKHTLHQYRTWPYGALG